MGSSGLLNVNEVVAPVSWFGGESRKFDSQVFGAFRGMVMVASGSLDLVFTKTSKVLQCLVGIFCDFSQCSDY